MNYSNQVAIKTKRALVEERSLLLKKIGISKNTYNLVKRFFNHKIKIIFKDGSAALRATTRSLLTKEDKMFLEKISEIKGFLMTIAMGARSEIVHFIPVNFI